MLIKQLKKKNKKVKDLEAKVIIIIYVNKT